MAITFQEQVLGPEGLPLGHEEGHGDWRMSRKSGSGGASRESFPHSI